MTETRTRERRMADFADSSLGFAFGTAFFWWLLNGEGCRWTVTRLLVGVLWALWLLNGALLAWLWVRERRER